MSHELETQHWRQRLGKQAALDIIAMGRIGTGNMEAISQMDEEDAVSALTIAMDWSTRVNKALGQIENNVIQEIESRKGFTLGLQERPDVKEIE